MKSIINPFYTLLVAVLCASVVQAQQEETLVIDESNSISNEAEAVVKKDSIVHKRVKVDGVIGVVGDYIVLESDIDKAYLEIEQQNIPVSEISRCQLFGKLLEDKLYAHHAIQDSIVVSDSEIENRTQQQIDYIVAQFGSEERAYTYYRKNSLDELRKELFDTNKSLKLAVEMQNKIYKDVEVTPDEIRQFFNAIPKEDLPVFGTEIEVAQIIIEPEITKESRQNVIDRLNGFRRDILENGVSFSTRAVLYSQDPGSAGKGGLYTLNKKDSFIKEFIDIAFSLEEGEISEPFETDFGFHILMVDKIRGQDRDVRHILLFPEVSEATIEAARLKTENIRAKIIAGEISFAEAARAESDEKETRNNGGILINPLTGDTRFDLTKMDPTLSAQVYSLKEKEVSNVFIDQDRTGRKRFKILTVNNRLEEHEADFSKDYEKIKELALNQKRITTIEKWQDEKIKETYININNQYNDCNFTGNWLKK